MDSENKDVVAAEGAAEQSVEVGVDMAAGQDSTVEVVGAGSAVAADETATDVA